MIASPRFVFIAASSSLALVAILLSAFPSISGFDVLSLIPEDILEVIPEVCQESEFNTAVDCAVSKLFECPELITTLPVFAEIPPPGNVTDCEDIQEPFCEIASTCDPCVGEFDDLIRCIVGNSEGIDANITELVDSCPLVCDE